MWHVEYVLHMCAIFNPQLRSVVHGSFLAETELKPWWPPKYEESVLCGSSVLCFLILLFFGGLALVEPRGLGLSLLRAF